MRIDRCHGRPILLHGRGVPGNFDVRGGLLTWDTGQNAIGFDVEEGFAHGTLTAYRLSNGRRRSWELPRLVLNTGAPPLPTTVVGYSTHTATTVFWVAARKVGGEKVSTVETSAVYAAKL